MITDPRIRELERQFAKFWRKPERRTYQFISPANDLILRRRMSIFCRTLFADKTFHRLIKHLDHTMPMPATMVFGLTLLEIWVSTGITRKVGKRLRNKYLQAKAEIEVAARVLRNYATNDVHRENSAAALLLAQAIEHAPEFAIEDDLRLAATIFDLGLIGQKGETRAFTIAVLNRILPLSIPKRDAMISDLLALIGIRASNHLVRSTIRKSRT